MEFYEGDRVRAISRDLIHSVGKDNIGTVAERREDECGIPVIWDIKFGGHDLDRRCKSGYGWWCSASDLALIGSDCDDDYDLTPASDEELSFLYS